MPRIIDTEGLRGLIDQGAQLIEVLPASAYDTEHLPGAQNIPLPDLTPDAVAELDRDRPVVVYCYDHECDLSPRGAALLEQLGFSDVYDYADSKTAWLGEGLPSEGSTPAAVRAGSLARTIPTCDPDATIATVRERFEAPFEAVVVVDAEGLALGQLRSPAAGLPDALAVLAVMDPGPPSVRPSITAYELGESMESDGRSHVLVTTSSGRLLGAIHRSHLTVDA